MATKRIVPFIDSGEAVMLTFADGDRQLVDWERPFASDKLAFELTGRALKELTYQEWLDKVYHAMQVRNQLVTEVRNQFAGHFRRS